MEKLRISTRFLNTLFTLLSLSVVFGIEIGELRWRRCSHILLSKEQGRVLRQASFFAFSWGIWIEMISGIFREVERSAQEVWEVVRFMSHYVLWSLDLYVFMSLVLFFWIGSFSVARVGLSL